MGSISTFGAFTTARLGIYASQMGLNVTGHNIANINTVGYSRQRLDQMSLRTGGAERYTSQYDMSIGSGVLCTGVSQLRDPYLDIRFRNESSSVGSMDAKLSVLEDLSSILDEVYKGDDHGGILEAQFNELQSQLKNLMSNPSDGISDGQVRDVADSLAKFLNSYSGKLDGIKETTERGFKEDIITVNNILKNIRDLNDTIQKSEIHGDSALELRDQRNNLLDELSQYMKISVETESVSIGAGKSVESMTITMGGKPGYVLVDGSYCTQLSMKDKVPQLNPDPDPTDPTKAGKYLDANGNATDILGDANMVDNTNYDLSLTELKNSFNAAWSELKSKTHSNHATEADADDALRGLVPGSTALPNGLVQSTTYEKVKLDDGTWSVMAKVTTTAPGTDLKDNDMYGSLQAMREMLTEAGEFSTKGTLVNVDADAAKKRGIPYYQNALDSLAQKFASVFNGANNDYLQDKAGNYLDASGAILKDPVSGDPLKKGTTPLDDPTLVASGVKVEGSGNLFSNSSLTDDGTGITASNISISHSWSIQDVKIVNSFIKGEGTEGSPIGPNSGDTTNILHLMSLFDADQTYSSTDIVSGSVGGNFFKGSFQKMLGKTCSNLASDVKTTTTLLNNYAASATELNTSRDSVSGVDLNDEATSLMQYQKSYAAACRLMTALDEALDKLINGTGVVGR